MRPACRATFVFLLFCLTVLPAATRADEPKPERKEPPIRFVDTADYAAHRAAEAGRTEVSAARATGAVLSGARPAILIIPSSEVNREPTATGAERMPPQRIIEPPPQRVSTPPRSTDDQAVPPGAAQDEQAPPPPVPPPPDGTDLASIPAEYFLLEAFTPDPFRPDLRYYVFADMRDPELADHWREFQRAQRRARRESLMEAYYGRVLLRRENRLLNRAEQAVYDGLAALRGGDYRQALLDFTLAADLNHGDPVSRIHLAQAQVALGHDTEAARALRRALELQPRLVPMRLSLDQYYAQPTAYDAQVEALADRIASKPAVPADHYVLLGFLEFQRGHDVQAYTAFRQAARGLPADERVRKFLALTKPALQ